MFFSAVAQASTQVDGHPVRDTVTFWLAVVSFILSSGELVFIIIKNYKNVSVCVKSTFKHSGYVVLSLQIENKSRLGISLTSGEIDDLSGHKIAFGEESTFVFAYSLPDLPGTQVLKTDIFPIHIEPLHSVRILMQTETWDPDLPLSCQLRFGSSRGLVYSSAVLPTNFDNIMLLSRCSK